MSPRLDPEFAAAPFFPEPAPAGYFKRQQDDCRLGFEALVEQQRTILNDKIAEGSRLWHALQVSYMTGRRDALRELNANGGY